MALKTTSTLANAALDGILDNINEEGGGNAAGYVDILTSGDVLLAHCLLVDGSVAAFGAASSQVATGHTDGGVFASDASANASGDATKFSLKDHSGTVRLTGTVGAGSGDLSLNSVTITSGQSVVITSFVVTLTGMV